VRFRLLVVLREKDSPNRPRGIGRRRFPSAHARYVVADLQKPWVDSTIDTRGTGKSGSLSVDEEQQVSHGCVDSLGVNGP